MAEKRKIFCCGCQSSVDAHLKDGKEIYPHRGDLSRLPFWKCDTCKNFVGCHHKTKNRTRPLGCIPTPAIKKIRSSIHAVLDPLWQSGRFDRSTLYSDIAHVLVLEEYHTAELHSVEQANEAYRVISDISAHA